jgi:hypothetical protein
MQSPTNDPTKYFFHVAFNTWRYKEAIAIAHKGNKSTNNYNSKGNNFIKCEFNREREEKG